MIEEYAPPTRGLSVRSCPLDYNLSAAACRLKPRLQPTTPKLTLHWGSTPKLVLPSVGRASSPGGTRNDGIHSTSDFRWICKEGSDRRPHKGWSIHTRSEENVLSASLNPLQPAQSGCPVWFREMQNRSATYDPGNRRPDTRTGTSSVSVAFVFDFV